MTGAQPLLYGLILVLTLFFAGIRAMSGLVRRVLVAAERASGRASGKP